MVKDIVQAVMVTLKADTNVTAKTSTSRIYKKILPTNPTFPAVVVSKVDDIRNLYTNTGDYATARIQCTAYASSEGAADELSELIATSLHNIVNSFLNGVYVINIEDAGTVPDMVPDISVYLYHRDFLIIYSSR